MPSTKSSPTLTPPPGVRQMPGSKCGLRISASRSPLKTKSVTSWRRPGLYVIKRELRVGDLALPSQNERLAVTLADRCEHRFVDVHQSLARSLSERPRPVDDEIGRVGQLVGSLVGRDRDANGHVQAVETAERVEVGRVVAGIERAS